MIILTILCRKKKPQITNELYLHRFRGTVTYNLFIFQWSFMVALLN